MDRKLLLETPAEQSKLLRELPEVIADEVEVQTSCKDISRKDKKNSMRRSATGLEPNKKSSCFLDAEENVSGLLSLCLLSCISIRKVSILFPLLLLFTPWN